MRTREELATQIRALQAGDDSALIDFVLAVRDEVSAVAAADFERVAGALQEIVDELREGAAAIRARGGA